MKKRLLIHLLFSFVVVLCVLFLLPGKKATASADWFFPFPTSWGQSRGFISHIDDTGNLKIDHGGYDALVNYGDPIYAPANGVVEHVFRGCNNHSCLGTENYCSSAGICNPTDGFTGDNGTCNHGFGNGVVIRTDDGIHVQFAHMSSVLDGLYPGKTIIRGMLLGYAGDTGNADGVHCHYGTSYGTSYGDYYDYNIGLFDPMGYIYYWPEDIHDTEKPVVTSIAIKNKTSTGYDAMCTVSDNWGIGYIQIGSWNSQDGLDHTVWQSCAAPDPDGVAVIHVNISDPWNTHYTNFYVFDSVGLRSDAFESGPIIIESEPPVVTMARVENVTMLGYDIVCEAVDNDVLQTMHLGTWNDVVGIDGAQWDIYEIDTEFPIRYHVSTERFGYLQNTTYHTNVFAFDTNNNRSDAYTVSVMIETEPPLITDHSVTNVTTNGYDVHVTAEDDGLVSKIKVLTWTSEMAEASAHELIQEFEPTQHAEALFHIDVADFSNARDVVYYTKAIAYDRCGNVCLPVNVASCRINSLPDLSNLNVLVLPADLSIVEPESFANTGADAVIIPAGCERISSGAFAGCTSLQYVIIQDNAGIFIEDNAFAGSSVQVFYTGSGS